MRVNGSVTGVFAKGFGFIKGDDGIDFFFHQSSCRSTFQDLRVNDRVSFTPTSAAKGPRAESVQLL